jgi:AcrR family transcriptional regulator
MTERASAHAHRKAATRDVIVNAAVGMLRDHDGAPLSHESIAGKTGIAARTIYRHFPTRADLTSALWVCMRDKAGIQWPDRETRIARSVKTLFRQFEKHSTFVRASIAAAAATEHPTHGSAEGRAAFANSLAELLKRLPSGDGQQLIAACVAIYSAPFWQMLRDRGQLSHTAAADTASWVLDAVIAEARRRATRSPAAARITKGEQNHGVNRSVPRSPRRERADQRSAQHRR